MDLKRLPQTRVIFLFPEPVGVSLQTVEGWFDRLSQFEQESLLKRLQDRKKNLPTLIPDVLPVTMANATPPSEKTEEELIEEAIKESLEEQEQYKSVDKT